MQNTNSPISTTPTSSQEDETPALSLSTSNLEDETQSRSPSSSLANQPDRIEIEHGQLVNLSHLSSNSNLGFFDYANMEDSSSDSSDSSSDSSNGSDSGSSEPRDSWPARLTDTLTNGSSVTTAGRPTTIRNNQGRVQTATSQQRSTVESYNADLPSFPGGPRIDTRTEVNEHTPLTRLALAQRQTMLQQSQYRARIREIQFAEDNRSVWLRAMLRGFVLVCFGIGLALALAYYLHGGLGVLKSGHKGNMYHRGQL